ncbi:hypothetical protein Q7C_1304 [Methylophaga frappieri]|uniref:tRNA(Met) cytidine acetyltransferase TmcA n=1 Tax=Methylophaga frappieri (strain ATCC BAA-2434 / DSM 25690 / JAM7) TaxID=754477 RepID=I1YHR1_METFJ|nr:GNAT family N-acetyltransferase [Methylophaga frappieri]AFJ02454.1 hypothetical protein Q7C_1304 [Methylophaga frappieri]
MSDAVHRFSLFCEGDSESLGQRIKQLRDYPDQAKIVWFAAKAHPQQNILSQSQASQYLGQETDLLIFDASEICRADALAAALGTLRGGGVFIMLLPIETTSRWMRRFKQLAEQASRHTDKIIYCKSDAPWPEIRLTPLTQTEFQLTQDQQHALQAIQQVAFGHRRRPLLMMADRGRGKSAVLGVAAASLLRQGKSRLLLTAPSKLAVKTVLQHYQRELEAQGARSDNNKMALQFIAPDQLQATLPVADVLLVDEAAALPQILLQSWLKHYARIIFSTTLQGYEGSGLGFKTQFSQILNRDVPGWQQQKLITPVRWQAGDPLEQFSYRALLLSTELERSHQAVNLQAELSCELVTSTELSTNPALMEQIFALLVSAHYRTRPSDLQALLDDENRTIWVLRDARQCLGVCWLNREGPLDEALTQAVHKGLRRLPGELLPQSLLTHAGDRQAGNLRYQRIIRIAIHPAYQRQNRGSDLVRQLLSKLPSDTDLIGCSFALQAGIYRFWQQLGFVPVRLGLHEDTMSAGRAVIMLKSCSVAGDDLIARLQQRFAEQWPELLPRYFADLPCELVKQITTDLPQIAQSLSEADKADISSFVTGQRALEYSFVPLRKRLWQQLPTAAFTACSPSAQAMLIQVLLQQQPITDVCRYHQLSGYKTLLSQLRQHSALLMPD